MAQTLRHGAFDCLQNLEIYLEDPDPLDQSSDPVAFCQNPEEDALSLAVGRVLQLPAIVKVHLTGFWTIAPAALESTTTSFGPVLESVSIEGSGTTPDGKWLSNGKEEDGVEQDEPDSDSDASEAAFYSEDSDISDFIPEHGWEREAGDFPANSWRTSLDGEVFVPHVLPMVEMTHKIPSLRTLRYELQTQPSPFFIEYFSPGVENVSAKKLSNNCGAFERDHVHRPRWFLTVVQGFDASWMVPHSLVSVMEEAGGCIFWDGPTKQISTESGGGLKDL